MKNLKIFVGYDHRERIAANVCKYSIERNLLFDDNADVMFLKKNHLQSVGYNRNIPNDIESTEFTYTRFLVPWLMNYNGYAIFCDCDFLFLSDASELLYYIDESLAVSVVKHPTYTPNSHLKMDSIPQHSMPRKNWASLMVFNCGHPSVKEHLTLENINENPNGKSFHMLSWAKDEEIGSIPMEWNCLDDYYYMRNPKAIHYTDGGPWFEDYKETMYSDIWKRYEIEYVRNQWNNLPGV